MPGINWRELGRRVGERSRLGQGLGLAVQLGSGGHDYRPEQEMERQRERTYERNLEAYLGRQKAKTEDEAGDEAFKAEQQRERLDAAAERARLGREATMERKVYEVTSRPPTPAPKPPSATQQAQAAETARMEREAQLRGARGAPYDVSDLDDDELTAMREAIEAYPSAAWQSTAAQEARAEERQQGVLRRAQERSDTAEERRAREAQEAWDKRYGEIKKNIRTRDTRMAEIAKRLNAERRAEDRRTRADLGKRVAGIKRLYATLNWAEMPEKQAIEQALAELKAEQAAAPALVTPTPRPEGDTAADDAMEALRKAAAEETPSPGGKPGAGGPAAAGAFEAGPQPMTAPPFASGASGAPTAAGLPTAMLPPKPALDLPGIRLEPQNEGDQPVYSNRATELAVSLLRRKDVDERIRALTELRANPEQFRQRGVDVDSVLAAFEAH